MRAASPADLAALRELFTGANDAPYDLGAVAEEKCFGAGISGEPHVRVIDHDARVIGASVTCGRFLRLLAVARDARRQGLGAQLLADAESRGAVVVAAEAGNYFTPGVVDTDTASLAFFRNRGYIETRWTHNLDVSTDIESGDGVRRPSHDEADRVLAFVEKTFGRIWRFEAAKAFDRETPTIFIAEDAETISGFAVHDVNNRGLGFFGPTGVAPSLRGRGTGCRLLRASLADLRRLGYARAVIPWTDALDFYRKCSAAEPAHRFVAFAKSQP
jgi:GNAT superfamily N-acetyltransferase